MSDPNARSESGFFPCKAAARGETFLRFNNRDNPYLFRDMLLRLIEGETLPLRELVHGEASA
jgi:hypothetical protein